MKCPSCGAETAGRYCEYCGSERPIDDKHSILSCPFCGQYTVTLSIFNGDTYRICQSCGENWNQTAQNEIEKNLSLQQEKEKRIFSYIQNTHNQQLLADLIKNWKTERKK